MIFRLRFIQRGGHIHCRLFQATAAGQTWQKNGELVFDEPGWRSFQSVIWKRIELLPEDDEPTSTTKEFSDPLVDFVRRGLAAEAAVEVLLSTPNAAADARAVYDLFSTMRTAELHDLLAAHRLDMEAATAPETIAFSAGRQALIAAVLKQREISIG